MTITYIPETEIIKHISEYILKMDVNHRVVITKDNHPIAAIVPIEDFYHIEQKKRKQGLVSVIGKWDDFDEVGDALDDIHSMRDKGGFGRDVSKRIDELKIENWL